MDKKEIEKLYIDENLMIDEIAKMLGKTHSSINHFLCRNHIKKPAGFQSKRVNLRKFIIHREDLEQFYIKENLSLKETAAKLGVSVPVIQRNLRSFGIKKDEDKKSEVKKRTSLNREWGKIVETRKKTCLEKYGVDNPSRVRDVQKKREQTIFRRYGVINPSQIDGHLEKSRKTCLAKYGIENYNRKHIPEETLKALESKESFQAWLIEHPNLTLFELEEIMGCSYRSIETYIHKWELEKLIDFCPFVSKEEKELRAYVESLGVECKYNTRKFGHELDILCPQYNIAIEFNGNYWHCDLKKEKNYHYNKSFQCEKNGIRLIHVYEYEWANKKDLVKSFLRIAFNKVVEKIYARECEIKKITNTEAKPFNDNNHMQGHRNAHVTYALFYKGKIVQLMSFGKNKKYGWEIIRGCPGSNNIVIGGVSKLFNAFIKEHDPEQVFSYCDYNKFSGVSYEKLGMKFIGFTGPDMKWWIKGQIVLNRNPRKHIELQTHSRGKIWGAGSKKYLWHK